MINRLSLIATSFALFASPLLAETPPIEKIAPENSVLIVGARNVQQATESFKRTGLWDLWQNEKIKGLFAESTKEMNEQLKEMLKDLGVEEDALTAPTGSLGLAMFIVTDPDLGTPGPGLLAVADYADNAEKTDVLVKAALERGVKEDQLDFTEKEVSGRTVLVIDLSKMAPPPGENDEGGMRMPMPMPVPDPEQILKGMKTMHYVRDGGTLMLCSDLPALTNVLEIIDAKGEGGKLAQREDYQNTVSQISSESDVYGVLLTRDSMDLANDPMIGMIRPMMRAAFGEFAGYAAGARFDSGGAMVEATLGAYMPSGKQGITKLLDNPASRSDLPAFIGSDTLLFTALNFDFSGLMDVIKSVINSNPMLAMQAQESLAQFEPIMTPIYAALGRKMYATVGSETGVVAIECTDAHAFEDAFATLAAQAGLEARDFLGQRIFSADGPPSFGIGGGFVFVGETPGVEQALRASGQTDAPTLQKDPVFQRAVGTLSNEPVVGWEYVDAVTLVDTTMRRELEAMKGGIEEFRKLDPEMAAEMEKDMAEREKVLAEIDATFLKNYVGPVVLQARSTAKGFIVNANLLSAMKN